MSSQRTFQSLLGKFTDGVEILRGTSGYNPGAEELKIVSLDALATDTAAKNAAVVTTGDLLKEYRDRRRLISFKAKDTDENCIENLMKAVSSYLKAEFGDKDPSYKKVDSILDRLNPVYEKKETPSDDKEPKKSNSKSEKTYQSLVGFGNDVITIITNLGAKYAPSNVNIQPDSFKAKIDELAGLNTSVVTAESNYDKAVEERSEKYNGENGIKKIISRVKSYLASLEGGKNNSAYKSYTSAVD